jgi:hypothetical protein
MYDLFRYGVDTQPIENGPIAAIGGALGSNQPSTAGHAPVLQHGPAIQAELVLLELVELPHDSVALAGQKTCADPEGLACEPQVDAGGLNLVGQDVDGSVDLLAGQQRLDLLRRKQARLAAYFRPRKIALALPGLEALCAEERHDVLTHDSPAEGQADSTPMLP